MLIFQPILLDVRLLNRQDRILLAAALIPVAVALLAHYTHSRNVTQIAIRNPISLSFVTAIVLSSTLRQHYRSLGITLREVSPLPIDYREFVIVKNYSGIIVVLLFTIVISWFSFIWFRLPFIVLIRSLMYSVYISFAAIFTRNLFVLEWTAPEEYDILTFLFSGIIIGLFTFAFVISAIIQPLVCLALLVSAILVFHILLIPRWTTLLLDKRFELMDGVS